MSSTYYNDDGVMVIDAGPVVLESASDVGQDDTEHDTEGADDGLRAGAGE